MKKIVDFEIYDIVPYSNGIIFAKKEMLDDNRCKVTFYGYDIKRAKPIPVTKSVYQLNKFGNAFKAICDNIGDYISCDTAVMRNKDIAVVYPSGETGIFDKDGNSKWSGDLFYHDSPVQGVAADGPLIWCTVPEQNAIINYSVTHKKFSLRIGGDSSTAFDNPYSLSIYGNELFICNAGSCKIRTINLKDFSVNDFRLFDEPIYRYLRVCGREIAVLESGVYIL